MRGVSIILIAVYLYGMAYYASAVIWPEQVQALYTQDPLTVGWYGMAVGIGGAIFSPIAGWIFRGFRRSHIMLPIILALLTIVSGAMAVVSPGSAKASTALNVLLGGLVGSTSVITTAVVQVGVAHEYIGIATGLVTCARAVGGAVATTIYSTILESRFAANLVTDVALPLAQSGLNPAKIAAVVAALVAGNTTDPALSVLTPSMEVIAVTGIKTAWSHAFRVVYLVSIAFGVAGTIVVCFSANVDHLLSPRVDIKVDEGAHIHGHTDTGEGHIIRHTIVQTKLLDGPQYRIIGRLGLFIGPRHHVVAFLSF